METKDQINQNPDALLSKQAQEEKTEAVKQTADDHADPSDKVQTVETGIRQEEKQRIVELISSPVASSAEKEPKAVKPKKKKKLIPKKLENQILDLLRDSGISENKKVNGKASKQKSKVLVETKSSHLVISETERSLILSLISDFSHKPIPSDPDSSDLEEVDFNDLNKQELVELIEEVVGDKDITKIKKQVALIKVAFYHRNKEDLESKLQAFVASGGKEDEFEHVHDPLENRFDQAFSIYKHNKAKYAESLEKEKQLNLAKKLEILEDLKELINSEETLKKTYDEFKILQDKWKAAGLVPSNELNDLWQNYHFLVERFFDKVRINKELRDLDLKKNLELKIELCGKAEELLSEDSVLKSFKLLQQFHDEWREIGPVPREMKDEVWERFKAATDKINQSRREHYKELHDEQQVNYEAKELLCEQIESFLAENEPASVKEWQRATDKLNELLTLWKSIGRAPKVHNDEVWKRFKTSLDQFYAAKRSFFSSLKEQQLDNYNRKLDLCVSAEAIKLSDDWKRTTKELINLQKEWKEIGPVPRKHSDKIWKRFRSACDEFFKRKSDFYKNSHHEEEDNLKKKQVIIESILNFGVKDDKKENLEALKAFQKEWLEIGHVPFHEKDVIFAKYKEAFDKLMNKLGLSHTEISNRGFKSRLEVFKNTPDGEHRLLRERSQMLAKLNKLKDDIILWENNIGFFSNSKQSNVLKAEFEKKIDRAKSDLEGLKQKIKMIDGEL